ncbi:protein of unknown function [Candidatus Promineifilum breve]|uniref:Uncharacterized protein n=1 Tax=Candidatus Promineifilum breve TaxID=1806508 RepID=A0A160T716_9CHLR|nr:protein of unknown function [Candidatus Promineifilum breve]
MIGILVFNQITGLRHQHQVMTLDLSLMNGVPNRSGKIPMGKDRYRHIIKKVTLFKRGSPGNNFVPFVNGHGSG